MEYIQEIEGQVGQLKNVSKEIRKKIRLGKLDEAYRLTAQYPNDLIIMSQRCTILIKQGRLEEAKIIGKQFEDDPIIQSQMVTIAIQEGDIERANAIGAKFESNEAIQSQMITIAIQEGRLEDAKAIGEKFQDNPMIQNQMITIAIQEGRLEEAKAIGARFKKYEPIQRQIMTIAIHQGNIERARGILEEFGNLRRMRLQFEKELKIRGNIYTNNSKSVRMPSTIQLLNQIKTRLYYNKIDAEVIEQISSSEELTEYERTVILLAICEKQKMPTRAKQIASKFESDDQMQNRTIKQIIERAKNKNPKIFPWEFYDGTLKWELDKKLSQKFEEERETEER